MFICILLFLRERYGKGFSKDLILTVSYYWFAPSIFWKNGKKDIYIAKKKTDTSTAYSILHSNHLNNSELENKAFV